MLVAIQDLHNYLARKAQEIQEAEDLVRKAANLHGAINPRQLALVNHALKTPDARYTVQSHQKSHDVSYETARSDLLGLVSAGFLEQHKRGRAFVFNPVPDLRLKLSRAAPPASLTLSAHAPEVIVTGRGRPQQRP